MFRFIRQLKVVISIAGVLSLSAAAVHGQRLAIRTYSVSEGLAHGVVISLHQDVKGYLWLATYEGLSRFDGYRFTNYGKSFGQLVVNDIVSDREGQIWAALNGGGVARLIDNAGPEQTGTPKLKTYRVELDDRSPANAVNRILFDAEHRLWCVTDAGLYRSRQIDVADGAFERIVPGSVPNFNNAAFTDSRGRLWFSVGTEVIQVAGGRVTNYRPARDAEPGLRDIPKWKEIHSILEDHSGRILAVESTGIYEFVELLEAEQTGTWKRWPLAMPPEHGIRAVALARDGGLWIGTAAGLVKYEGGSSKLYRTENGLSSNSIRALLLDREGTLWIGTEGSGLCKLSGEVVVSYTSEQHLPSPETYHLAEDHEGRIYATVGCAPRALVTISNEQVRTIPSTRLAASHCYKSHLVRDAFGNTWYHMKAPAIQDIHRNWWFQSPRGLEFSRGPQFKPDAGQLVGAADGFPENYYSEIHADSDGQIWIVNGLSGNLYVATPRVERPLVRFVTGGLNGAEFVLRDKAGTLWIASSDTIWRLSNGALTRLKESDGLPAIEPRVFFQDEEGRLWIGLRYHGVSMTTEPEAANPRFVNYNTGSGLTSDTVWSVSADDQGHIYLGTGRGLDRLDVATGKVRHFTADDGVVGSVIEDILKDRQGHIWVASDGGITKIDPKRMHSPKDPPPIFISRLLVAGEEWPLPVTGAQHIASIQLPYSRNNLSIEFVGLSYQSERLLSYQYKLEGANADWSPPSQQRTVDFAQLAPGRYRFLVRAIGDQDFKTAQPASVEFEILSPIYLRSWFLALAALFVAAIVYTAYRYRVARLLEVAAMRTRIAADLHDDIGANLTRIAILSEVSRQQAANNDPHADGRLSSIARISRESVASMSDIVWAISPDRDTFQELVRKMRDHAEGVFDSLDVALKLDVAQAVRPLKFGVNVRRDLYLIFKEAVNNAARHSGCTRVQINIGVAGPHFVLEIADDGAGFDLSAERDGHGLTSIKRRADRLGAELDVRTGPGHGTVVRLKMPLAPRARLQGDIR